VLDRLATTATCSRRHIPGLATRQRRQASTRWTTWPTLPRLLAQQDARDAVVIGCSLGGWIAAEMAVKCTERVARLVLIAPLGIKVGDRETRTSPTFSPSIPTRSSGSSTTTLRAPDSITPRCPTIG